MPSQDAVPGAIDRAPSPLPVQTSGGGAPSPPLAYQGPARRVSQIEHATRGARMAEREGTTIQTTIVRVVDGAPSSPRSREGGASAPAVLGYRGVGPGVAGQAVGADPPRRGIQRSSGNGCGSPGVLSSDSSLHRRPGVQRAAPSPARRSSPEAVRAHACLGASALAGAMGAATTARRDPERADLLPWGMFAAIDLRRLRPRPARRSRQHPSPGADRDRRDRHARARPASIRAVGAVELDGDAIHRDQLRRDHADGTSGRCR